MLDERRVPRVEQTILVAAVPPRIELETDPEHRADASQAVEPDRPGGASLDAADERRTDAGSTGDIGLPKVRATPEDKHEPAETNVVHAVEV